MTFPLRNFRRPVNRTLQIFGFKLIRNDPDRILIPRYLCPSAHKLYDFRKENVFSEIADEILDQGRTTFDYNRLFVLWQAVKNTSGLDHAVAEIGVYKGGSARFMAAAFRHWNRSPKIHIFDTFKGHPDQISPRIDGPHTEGFFSDTNADDVKNYLSPFPNVETHVGTFEESSGIVADDTFCLVHIDVDIYRSAVNGLQFFWPRLCVGGVIVVDDYGFETCRGMKRAVDEFIDDHSSCQSWYMHTGQIVLLKGNKHET